MKNSLSRLLDPQRRPYLSLGELVLVLRSLLATAHGFRNEGRRGGSTGPTEILSGYAGCVNCEDQAWHSCRRWLTTYPEHVSNICEALLSALCAEDGASVRWREAWRLSLDTSFSFCAAASCASEEEKAFGEFMALHGCRLPRSLNPFHRDAKVLCFPQLVIGQRAISLTVEVSGATELRTYKNSASRWSVASLLEAHDPKWDWRHETFAQFLTRGAALFRNAQPVEKAA